jgi:aldehyde dehydrogenase (NAD+)/aldehyde dehydrogenase
MKISLIFLSKNARQLTNKSKIHNAETMIGSQVSKAQCEKIVHYINIGKEGAVVL